MKLTHKLLGYLHRAFSKDPVQFLALRLRYDGTMTWSIEDGILRTSVTSTGRVPGASLDLDFVLNTYGQADLPWDHVLDLEVDLSQYSIAELADFLRDQPGYTVEFEVLTEASTLSARVLMDGQGDQGKSNGDHLYAYTSLTWAYLEANAVELKLAREQIYQMLRQMSVPTAESEWLDEIGGYYNVWRRNGETDENYGPRIVDEIVQPRSNNKAIELAISKATGGAPSKVVDVTLPGDLFPLYNGAITYNGARTYSVSGKVVRNLFDVTYAFDLEGSEDIAPFQARVLGLIDSLRAAGTHLRQILLTGSQLTDAVPFSPDDDITGLTGTVDIADTVTMPDEQGDMSATVTITDISGLPTDDDINLSYKSTHTYDGQHFYGGEGRVINYDSGETVTYDSPTLELNFFNDSYLVEV